MRLFLQIILLSITILSCESGDSIPTPTDEFADLKSNYFNLDSQTNFAEDQNYFDESTKVFEGSGGIKIDGEIIYFDFIECFRDSVKYTFEDGVKSTMAYRIRGQKPDYEVLNITIMDEPLSGYYGYNFYVIERIRGSYSKYQTENDFNVTFRPQEYKLITDNGVIFKFDNSEGQDPYEEDIRYKVSCFIECH